jgi:membrane protease YdiL (CAAX protease family)
MATANATPYAFSSSRTQISVRDIAELIFGYGLIVGIIWSPEPLQRLLTPFALAATASIVLVRGWNRNELGLGLRGLIPSLWILPASAALAFLGIFLARALGTLHPLYKADFTHISGYVLWTIYQQFLLQDYFMPRLQRVCASQSTAITLTAVLFAAAHLPNLPLTAATLLWGAASAILFLRYRNIWILGLAQGLLGLCFAICVPDAINHHLRVGLGYLHYRPVQPLR